ncbi:MAG TPA: ferredoxin [Terriglobales bacterium]|nr:ferredoxin [Terriglobales bacterium]
MCISCGAPEAVAPDLVGFYETPSGNGFYSHCYFKKQPQTKEELERAVKAVQACCVGSYYYAGSDPEVKKMLRRAGREYAIDD